MTDRIFNVLFLCTGNTARSVLAEGILRKDGAGRFKAFSAGSQPKGIVNPFALKTLAAYDYPADGYRSKSWDEFASPDAPPLDLVVTVCGNAASETCPVWPGNFLRAHWGIDDPAAATGSEADIRAAFMKAYALLAERILTFLSLSFETMERSELQHCLDEIGRAGAAATIPESPLQNP